MASPTYLEKEGLSDPSSSLPPSSAAKSPFLSVVSPFTNAYSHFAHWRKSLDLPNPGTVENLQKEVKTIHLTNWMFDGARADLTKSFSTSPIFQVTHSFSLGSQSASPSYNFGAVFGSNNVFMQGGVDHEGNLNGRFNSGWSQNNVTKVQAQLSSQAGHNMVQLEQDYQGSDFCLNAKAINLWPTDLTGIYIGSYIQSITKNIAIGVESLYQRPSPGMSEFALSYLAKYTGSAKNWIATAHVQPAGIMQATYWQKLSDKVEAAVDLSVIMAPGRRDAIATVGAKYDLRMATFRAQFDSTGKVGALLEQRMAPTFAFLFSGEIDHFKNTAKVGVGVMIESPSEPPPEEMMGMPGQTMI